MKRIALSPEDRETLHQRVSHAIREAILDGTLKPGERLVQDELSEQLGVSRMPVREALRQLESEGLITFQTYKGAIVNEFTKEDIIEIYHLRALLEPEALALSIPHLKADDLQTLDSLCAEMEQHADDPEAYTRLNSQFHRLLIAGCKWERLKKMVNALWTGFPLYTPHYIKGQIAHSNKEHRQILNSVKRKDADEAKQLFAKHIRRSGEHLLEKMTR